MSTLSDTSDLLRKNRGTYAIPAFIIILTGLCVFTPPLLIFRQLAAYTFHIMIAMMILGFFAFLIKKERIMLFSLLCCCILCLHLKGSANKQMRYAAVTTNPSLKICHVSLGNAENDYDMVIDYLAKLDADFISFQELTPDWSAELTSKLSPEYQYINTITRLDQYGMGFFSKFPFHSLDTVYCQNVPNFATSIMLGKDQLCNVISCQVIPPVNQAAFKTISEQFNSMDEYMKHLNGSVIVLGDLHLPPWATEVQQFKINGNLQDSRRDTNPRYLDGSIALPRIPVEHIFYGENFECTSFSEIGNNTVGRLGITGTYQIHEKNAEVVQ